MHLEVLDAAVANLLPHELTLRAKTLSRDAFTTELAAPLLLVRVDDPASELSTVLQRGALGERVPMLPAIGFSTTSRLEDGALAIRTGPFGPTEFKLRVSKGPYVAVPLRKRAGGEKNFIERVSLGRALNNDIVIRHQSVSKLHAWFVRDEAGGMYAADAGSKNKTLLNGEPLSSITPCCLVAGDALRFGAIEAIICPPEILWTVVRG